MLKDLNWHLHPKHARIKHKKKRTHTCGDREAKLF